MYVFCFILRATTQKGSCVLAVVSVLQGLKLDIHIFVIQPFVGFAIIYWFSSYDINAEKFIRST